MDIDNTRVFLAESDPDQIVYLTTLLSNFPHIDLVGQSASGRETLRVVEEIQPDILVIALALREYDGIYVLEQIYNHNRLKYPRVAVTTVMSENHGERCLEIGADIVFAKPIDESAFLDWLFIDKKIINVAQPSMHNRREVTMRTLDSIGMSKSLTGYAYLIDAISMASTDHSLTQRMMSDLYPRVADLHENTVSCVERSIRHAIEETWTSGRLVQTDKLFGYSIDPKRGKPTNAQCIARIAEYVRSLLVDENAS
ncbi:stage 0 sporulation protein A [Clostridia bacterium]|nr:stage 0 sporulation protein A [Clostridia bacterium]